jgi:hypothetical protein
VRFSPFILEWRNVIAVARVHAETERPDVVREVVAGDLQGLLAFPVFLELSAILKSLLELVIAEQHSHLDGFQRVPMV